MTHKYDGYNWIVRFEKGEKLMRGLVDFVRRERLPNCWVSGLGATSSVELGFYHLTDQKYRWQKTEELLEILSLQGNIAGHHHKPSIHLHGVFSRQNMETIGGHVKELVVGGTCELFLHHWYGDSILRFCDEETGLNLLDL